MSLARPVLRLAIIGTPRSGNTWVRGLLAAMYDLEQIAAHVPEEIDWENLPDRCVIQIHWPPWPRFVARLERLGVRVVSLARHPLDVLMSWLNHAYYDHLDGHCRGPGVCKECSIVGASPRSDAVLSYVQSEPGQILFGFSPAWWDRPDVIQARYEDLVADAETQLARLADQVGEPSRRPLAEVVESASLRRMKPNHAVRQFHYWQGRPGLWRAMLPAAEARAIQAAVPIPFDVLGYPLDPDDALEPARADQNWLQLQLDSTREHLQLEHEKHRKKIHDLHSLQAELAATRQALREAQLSSGEMRRSLAALESRLNDLDGQPSDPSRPRRIALGIFRRPPTEDDSPRRVSNGLASMVRSPNRRAG